MSLRCGKCGAIWPDDFDDEWGHAKETQAYGPEPLCVNITEDRRGNRGVCRGRLVASSAAVTHDLTPPDGDVLYSEAE